MDAPRRRAADRPYTIASAPSDPAKLASGTAGMPANEKSALNVIAQHRAERGAGRHAERVGRRERVAQQRLEHDAGEREALPDERGREHARQPGDEEDLRVDVVRERDASGRRRAPRRMRRAADERRQEAAPRAPARRSRRASTHEPRADGSATSCGAMGTTVRCPASRVALRRRRRRRTASRMFAAVSISIGRAAARAPALFQQHEASGRGPPPGSDRASTAPSSCPARG